MLPLAACALASQLGPKSLSPCSAFEDADPVERATGIVLLLRPYEATSRLAAG